MNARIKFIEDTAPGTPPTGYVYLYAKTDGKVYFKGDDGVERALEGTAGAQGPTGLSASAEKLISMIHCDLRTTRRDLVRAGFTPAFFNQQWGGGPMPYEIVNSVDNQLYAFDAPTGYIDQEGTVIFGNTSGQGFGRGQGFKVSKSGTLKAIWVKILKAGNPTDNVELKVYTDSGGVPSSTTPITNGTATAIGAKTITADPNGQWVRFSFPTPPSLTAGTAYHFNVDRSGAADGTNNFYITRRTVNQRYPHGNASNATSADAWAAEGNDHLFIVEMSDTENVVQSGGTFGDGKLVFFEGNPLDQSGGYCRAIRDIKGFDPRNGFTLLLRGTAFTKDKTIWEMQYGLDHDRIVLRCNVTTGFAQVDVYEKDGTKHTVTATSVDLSSGDHDVAIYVRANNDGSDRVDLYVDGAANGTPVTSASIDIDPLFVRLGTEWLGGGFAVAPTWTQKLAMGVLPSADSPAWTYTGVTEANAFSVAGSRLYQNYNAFGSTDVGNYSRSTLSLSNANGWTVALKNRVMTSTNTKGEAQARVLIEDGTKVHATSMQEYFFEDSSSATYPQVDLKGTENVVIVMGKGSDALTFVNGRFTADASAKMTNASANNKITFGDTSNSAGENGDVIWDYVAFYNTAWISPQFTSGSLSEYALWSGDKKTSLSGLWNSGTEVSVKSFAGVQENWLGTEAVQRVDVIGVTSSPTTTVTSLPFPTANEMEGFVIGSRVIADSRALLQNSTSGVAVYISEPYVDGSLHQSAAGFALTGGGNVNGTNGQISGTSMTSRVMFFGLHKVDVRWAVAANTGTLIGTHRRMGVEAKA